MLEKYDLQGFGNSCADDSDDEISKTKEKLNPKNLIKYQNEKTKIY